MSRRLVGLVLVAGAVFAATTIAATPPAAPNVHDVTIVAKKFGFEPSEIQVVAGEPVRLVLRTVDSAHSFAIRELKIDIPIPTGGDPVVAEFTAPPAGRYDDVCSEFCGRGHTHMKASLVSVAPPRATH